MQIKLLKSVVENLVNKEAVPIIDLLIGNVNVNEFLIAKKLNLTINQTRNILYKLSDYGLVSFIRKKDKKKGWYIYFWTLNTYQALNLLEENLKNELKKLEDELKNRGERRYYFCNTCSIEVSEETALLNDFKCSECEEIYQLASNQDIIKNLEKEISKLKKDLALVSEEKSKEFQILEKKKSRKIRRAESERKKYRKAEAEKRKLDRLKEEKARKKKKKTKRASFRALLRKDFGEKKKKTSERKMKKIKRKKISKSLKKHKKKK